jgi:hypothetical protein
MVLAVLSIASGYIFSPFWTAEQNFETWTATPIIDEEATYPFADHGGEDAGSAVQGEGVLAAAPTLAAEGGELTILHGAPTWHPDLLLIVLAVFGLAVVFAWRVYGNGACPNGTRPCTWVG